MLYTTQKYIPHCGLVVFRLTYISQWEGLELLWKEFVPSARGLEHQLHIPPLGTAGLETNKGQNYRKTKNNAPKWRSWILILRAEAVPSSLLALAQALCRSVLDSTWLHKICWNYCLWILLPGLPVPLVLGTALCFVRILLPFQTHCPKFHTSDKALSSYAPLKQLS